MLLCDDTDSVVHWVDVGAVLSAEINCNVVLLVPETRQCHGLCVRELSC